MSEAVVWQPRCVFCGCEHYIMAINAISHGHAPCHRCGRTPPVYTDLAKYRAALKAVRG